ncbi:MAG: MBL fold metallo-hydrolase [Fibrobacter sp.]|nr:MBL fold metallo-hydrolase [Fibrobacter sp.]
MRPIDSVNITIVAENHSSDSNLVAEHGLCLHIDNGAQSILFDAGRSDSVIDNLKYLQLEPKAPQFIALSHGHYDHCNGVPALRQLFPQAQLHFNPLLLDPKWVLDDNSWRYGGLPRDFHPVGDFKHGFLELIPGVFASGHVISAAETQTDTTRFYRNPTGELQKDAFNDEQIILVHTNKGLSVISGCMHCGLDATIKRSRELFPKIPFYALVGGFHLVSLGEKVFNDFVNSVKKHKFRKIMPLHCSGLDFVSYLRTSVPNLLLLGECGSKLIV